MTTKTFKISVNGIELLYQPASGYLHNLTTSEIIQICKTQSNHFPLNNIGRREPFKPYALTVYLNHLCNLACEYCYIPEKDEFTVQTIQPLFIQAAADLVAKNCATAGKPFIVGFHGGNEPLLNPTLVAQTIEICQKAACKYGLKPVLFCTTNGIISESTAIWAVNTFDCITLSWDGPAEIHDRFRKFPTGEPTSSIVSRTAAILIRHLEKLKELNVRVSVTKHSVHRLLEITRFFYEQTISRIHFFPVYQNSLHKINPGIQPEGADFVKNFLLARKWGEQHNMSIFYSGSRISDFHHQFCPVLQHNLAITPDGFLSACFLVTHNNKNQNDRFVFGEFDQAHNVLEIDEKKLNTFYSVLNETGAFCQDCFNYLHCAKGCPEICPFQKNYTNKIERNCVTERWIGLANILEYVGINFYSQIQEDCESFFSSIVVEPFEEEPINVPV